MPRTIRVRAERSPQAAAYRACLVLLLAWSMSLALRVPAAVAQTTPNLWSIQLDGGLLVLDEARGPSPRMGMRYSKHYTPYVQGGLLTGFVYKGTRLEATAASTPNGDSHVELGRTDARLVPVMWFTQVDLTEKSFFVPFLGIAAGYEWLAIRTTDHQTGRDSTATYGNMAWESYAGLGFRFARNWRLNGELFYNGGSLERHVLDPDGSEWREAVHVNGVGARVGLDMVFLGPPK